MKAIPLNKETLKERFDVRWYQIPFTSCWIWNGAYNQAGYGSFMVKMVTWSAHRLSWFLHRGEIPKGMCVCHRYDVRGCVNPDHLFLGTHTDNQNDAIKKGRRKYPIGHGTNWESVRQITSKKVRLVCKRGLHPLSGQNLFIDKKGHRLCKECSREKLRKWRRKS